MEGEDKRTTQLKCAFVLNKFLEENKALASQKKNSGEEDLLLVDNLSKLASATTLRPATISGIFNADSNPSIANVVLVVAKLQRSLSEFGKVYDEIRSQDLELFTNTIAIKKSIEQQRKSTTYKNSK